jgi:hypothetical protein
MATDLTFQQLADAAPTGSITVSGSDVIISMSTLTGDTISTLSQTGVIEACIKLLNAAEIAQATANTGIASPNRLASFFSSYSSVTSTNGIATTQNTRSVTGLVTLNQDEILGTNN